MDKIKIRDKVFVKSIDQATILASVKKIADQLNVDYRDDVPVFIGVLNGSFIFAADLLREFNGNCELTFLTLSSYSGTESTGEVKLMSNLVRDIKNRRVIILEDIVDSGITVKYLIKEMAKYEPSDVRIAALLLKPDAFKTDVKLDYVGMEIPNDFIVGYGLDYDGYGRNYKDIYKVIEE